MRMLVPLEFESHACLQANFKKSMGVTPPWAGAKR
jgi:hypothetical protein